jgi:hypothetical protein
MKNLDPVLAWGEYGTVYRDGTFHDPNGTLFTLAEMNAIKQLYGKCNRIYKPFNLLFYTDVMNGKRSLWIDTGESDIEPRASIASP